PLWVAVAGQGTLAEGPPHGASLVVGHGGLTEEVAAGGALVGEAARARSLHTTTIADAAALRARVADVTGAPAAAVLRAAMLPSDVGPVIERIGLDAARVGALVRVLAEPASGVVRVAVTEASVVPALVRALRPRLEIDHGSLVVERAVAAVKAGLDVWGDAGPGLALMRRVKVAFDPASRFA